MKHMTLLATAAGTLYCGALAWGGLSPQQNQPAPRQQDPGRQRPNADRPAEHQQPAQRAPVAMLVSYKTLTGTKVVSGNDRDRSGEVDHLVINTRNGRVAYALVDTNGMLGSENRVVAVPYGALTWNPARKWFDLDVTEAQFNSLSAVDASDLSRFSDPTWLTTMRSLFSDRQDPDDLEHTGGDEYSPHFRDSQMRTLNGRILSKHDAKTAGGAECQTIVLRDDRTNQEHTVYLAPAAHLTRHRIALNDGDAVVLSVIDARSPEGKPVCVAQTIQVDGRTLPLRDARGTPAWDSSESRAAGRPFRLASDIKGTTIHAGDDKLGTVNDLVLEAHSGAVAFAVISVGGLLGIGDTLYAIPCSALTFRADDDLFIDMPVSRLKDAPKLSGEGAARFRLNRVFAFRRSTRRGRPVGSGGGRRSRA